MGKFIKIETGQSYNGSYWGVMRIGNFYSSSIYECRSTSRAINMLWFIFFNRILFGFPAYIKSGRLTMTHILLIIIIFILLLK